MSEQAQRVCRIDQAADQVGLVSGGREAASSFPRSVTSARRDINDRQFRFSKGNGMSTVSVTGFLSVADAAAILDTIPAAVLRLIARGLLKATRLKTEDNRPGEWLIRSADLDAYVGSGARDLQMPEMDFADGDGAIPIWFSDRFKWMSDRLKDALSELAVDQEISTETFQDAVNSRPQWERAATIAVDIKLTPAMRSLLIGPPVPNVPNVPGAPAPRESTWFDVFAGVALHAAAFSKITVARYGLESPIATLYDSPDRYREIVSAAVRTVAEGSFFRYSVYRRDESRDGSNVANDPIRVEYRLKISSYATPKDIQRVADKFAF